MSIKLIAVDMDGTLLTTDQRITERTETAIKRAMDAGIEFVLDTGRSNSECEAFYPQLPMHYSVFANGAYILDFKTGENLISRTIPVEDARKIYEIYARYNAVIFIQGDHWVYACEDFPVKCRRFPEYIAGTAPIELPYRFVDDQRAFLAGREDDIEKFHVSFISHEEAEKAFEELSRLPYQVVWCGEYCVEVTHPEADKGRALGLLADRLGIKKEEVMAIGDSGNDALMLEYAGTSVVVANASPELKDCADMVVPSNNDDGVAAAIEWVLENDR